MPWMLRVLSKTLLRFAAVALALYLAACAYLYFEQRQLLYFPQPARGHEAPALPLRASGPGPRVLVSTRELPGAQAVVYFGGNAEDVSRTVPLLASAFPGQSLYLLHYRGYGGSEGAPTEDGLVADALALFDQVHAAHARVTVVGRSLGSGLAVHVAGERPVARLVLVTPYDSMVGVAAAHYPYIPVSLLVEDRYESFRYAPQVRAPTRIIAADDDRVVPRASTEQLRQRFAPGVATMVVLPGVGHNTISQHPRYLQLLSAP
jgi:pimeloyl-ACP methyl ester carboxylesterase